MAISVDAHEQSRRVIQESFECAFASGLLLRAVLINHSARCCSNLADLVPDLSLFLCFHVPSVHLLEGLLTHEHQLVVCNTARFVSIRNIHVGSQHLGWRLADLSVAIVFYI